LAQVNALDSAPRWAGPEFQKHESGTAEGARRVAEQAPDSPIAAGGGRWSSKRKLSVILGLLRGADLESASRKRTASRIATLTEWRDRFLDGGQASLKSREVEGEDEDKRRLKSALANVSVDNELLREKIARLETNGALAFWKSKP
jgi:transposase-like protein